MTALHVERQGAGPRVVLVHGFTQTGRSWGPIAADLAPRPRGRAGRRTGPRRLGGRAGRPDGGRGAARRGRWPGHLRRLLDGRPAGAAPGPGPAGPGRRPGAPRRDRRDRGRQPSGPPAAARTRSWASELERDGLDPFLQRWLAQPLFADLPADAADLDDRRRNTVDGLASSLRLAGTGSQAPRWDRARPPPHAGPRPRGRARRALRRARPPDGRVRSARNAAFATRARRGPRRPPGAAGRLPGGPPGLLGSPQRAGERR